jgi:hypothetical protein
LHVERGETLGSAFLPDAAASRPDTPELRILQRRLRFPHARLWNEGLRGWLPGGTSLALGSSYWLEETPVTYYNKFQLIAYQVPTDRCFKKDNGKIEKAENRFPAGDRCQIASTRLKDMEQDLTAGLSADALSRLMRMIAVAEKAATSLDIDTARNTLKIFMAPEFYFRPELKGTTSWSYTLAEKELIEKALGKVFSAKEYESWLFVFGTIVWHRTTTSLVNGAAELADVKKEAKLAEVGDTAFLLNAALIVEGGTDKAFTLVKRHFSDADDIDARYRLEGAAVAKSPLNDALSHPSKTKLRNYLTKLKDQSLADPIFPVGDNLTLSLEICREHELRVVPVAVEKLKDKYRRLDLQLLTACGMRVQEKNLCISDKQFVIRVDGAANVIPDWPGPWDYSIEIQQVLGRTDDDGAPYTSSPYAKEMERQEAWRKINGNPKEIPLQGSLKLKAGDLMVGRRETQANQVVDVQKQVDAAFPQQLLIYSPLAFEHGVIKGAEKKPKDYQEPLENAQQRP